jgi:protein-tyrosine phosphatase
VYGVDDGAADLEESVAIARQFVSEGVTRIAVTPHFNPDNEPGRQGADAALVRMRVAELELALADANVPLEINPGNELYLTTQALELLRAGTVSCLGGGKTVLVELSLLMGQKPLFLNDLMFQLQLAGYGVVLAHPERYPFVEHDASSLDQLVESGVIMQLTAPSLLGDYGAGIRRIAERLLQREAYRVASSDRHHPGPARSLAQLHERIVELANAEMADCLLCHNPAAVLDGTLVLEHELKPVQKSSLFGRVLGRRRG